MQAFPRKTRKACDTQTYASCTTGNTSKSASCVVNAYVGAFVQCVSPNSVSSVAFSPDGKTIVSGSNDGTVRLWDLEGNQIDQPFQGHKNYVNSVAFSPDGKTIVSGSHDGTVRLWDLEGNQIDQPFQGHKESFNSVAFSPDGKTIVSGSDDRTIRLWRGARGKTG